MFSSVKPKLFFNIIQVQPSCWVLFGQRQRETDNEQWSIDRLALAGQSHVSDKVISGICQDSTVVCAKSSVKGSPSTHLHCCLLKTATLVTPEVLSWQQWFQKHPRLRDRETEVSSSLYLHSLSWLSLGTFHPLAFVSKRKSGLPRTPRYSHGHRGTHSSP